MSGDGFVRSSFCSMDSCVEVKQLPDGAAAVRGVLRDVVLRFTADEWLAFVRGVKAGEFDDD